MKKIIEIFKEMYTIMKEEIRWSRDKELIEEQIKIDTHKIDIQNITISKLKNQIKELKQFEKEKETYEEQIKELQKENRKLKRELKKKEV